MKWVPLAHLAAGLTVLGIYLDNVHLRRRERRQAEEAAALTARALSGMVQVGDLTLPLPDDSRWKPKTLRIIDGYTAKETDKVCLAIGNVSVDDHTVFFGPGTGVRAPKYVKAVWTAYQNRVARKAIDSPGE